MELEYSVLDIVQLFFCKFIEESKYYFQFTYEFEVSQDCTSFTIDVFVALKIVA